MLPPLHPRPTISPPPTTPKIYHIVHWDRLASIVSDGYLWCNAGIRSSERPGTSIGMDTIKQRRLSKALHSYKDLHVGDCVPFYFCPRSVMLYVIFKGNHRALAYEGGQGPILHLEADLQEAIAWASQNAKRWVFTPSNAGSSYVDEYCDLAELNEINWEAVEARNWQNCKEGKQAESLMEGAFPWTLIRRVGVLTPEVERRVHTAVGSVDHRPTVEVKRDWYYS